MRKYNLLVAFVLMLALNNYYAYSVDNIKIALSKGSGSSHYQNYYNWLKKADPKIEIIDMYSIDPKNIMKELATCNGILFTGGDDIAPGRFGKAADSVRCEIDYKRDTLEFALFETALKLKIPILGICRGEQLITVATGGSLIVDIPQDVKNPDKHQCELSDTCYHHIKIESSSLLNKICGVTEGFVTTNHHQAALKISPRFVASSHGIDGVAESIERRNNKNNSFLLGVQWHHEKMKFEDPCSGNIAKYFIEEVKKYAASKKR